MSTNNIQFNLQLDLIPAKNTNRNTHTHTCLVSLNRRLMNLPDRSLFLFYDSDFFQQLLPSLLLCIHEIGNFFPLVESHTQMKLHLLKRKQTACDWIKAIFFLSPSLTHSQQSCAEKMVLVENFHEIIIFNSSFIYSLINYQSTPFTISILMFSYSKPYCWKRIIFHLFFPCVKSRIFIYK